MSSNNSFISDAETIDQRIRARLSLAELFAIAFSICMIGVFIWLQSQGLFQSPDYDHYINTAFGNYQIYFYANWAVPIYHLFAWMPHPIGYALWNVINIAGVFYAARIFDGKPALTLLSYQFLYTLFYGSMTGIIIGCLALFWWAAAHKQWHLAGLGLILAATKFQTGMLIGGVLWLAAPIAWRDRLRTLIVPVVVFVFSLLLYPGWISQLYQRILITPPDDNGSISLWRWIGPFALLFLIIPIVIPALTKEERIVAFFAASALALPYFQQADLVSVFVFPTGWIPLSGNLGFLFPALGWSGLQLLFIVPLGVLIAFSIYGVRRWLVQRAQIAHEVG